MSAVPLALLKRDRLIVVASLAVVTALAWVYLFTIAGDMTHSGMAPGDMAGMLMPETSLRTWTAQTFAVTFAMWAVMMVGMMLPSASPMILLYARVAQNAAQQGKAMASVAWFAGGYLLSWTVFSVAATMAQAMLERTALITPMMVAASNRIGGAILIAAGLYQWTSFKNACLHHCRSPFEFIQSHGFGRDARGSLRIGFRHGLYCIGCCWALMSLLFAVGVMNIVWIALISAFVLLEKVLPGGKVLARVSGTALLFAGLWLMIR